MYKEFARNVEILRKSKEDTNVDMAEPTAAASAMQAAFDPDLDDAYDMPDELMQMNGVVDVRWMTTPFVYHTI